MKSESKIDLNEIRFSATDMRLLIYSDTSHPGLASNPIPLWKQAWYGLTQSAWLLNVVTSAAFLAAGYFLGAGKASPVAIILVSAGVALVVGAILMLIFYVGMLIFLASRPP